METAEFWFTVGLTATLRLLHFSLIFSFYCYLLEKGWAVKVAKQFAIWKLVAYKPVAHKKNKCITIFFVETLHVNSCSKL